MQHSFAGLPAPDIGDAPAHTGHRISIVIAVYRGEQSLGRLMAEIEPLTAMQVTRDGNTYQVSEVLLVHDCGPDRSDLAIEALSARHAFVRPIWLSRNFGQHAAMLAGMANASGDWVVTMDEDGQQNPADIDALLDQAVRASLQLVYAKPSNAPPHGLMRNLFSGMAKQISSRVLGNTSIGSFNSYRLIDGEIARALAAHCRNGVYLDVALLWVAGRIGHCPVCVRREERSSNYSYLQLFGHFWKLVLSTGTRPLRWVTFAGCLSMLVAVTVAAHSIHGKLYGAMPPPEWVVLLTVVSFFCGAILAALGLVAEYLSVTMGIAMGKPLYVIVNKPTRPAAGP